MNPNTVVAMQRPGLGVLTLRPPASVLFLDPAFHLSGQITLSNFFSHFLQTMIYRDRENRPLQCRVCAADGRCRGGVAAVRTQGAREVFQTQQRRT